MKRLTTYIAIVAALVVGVVAPFAQAARPTRRAQALEIRGQALNRLCEDSTITGAAYTSLCGTTGAGNRPRMIRAERARDPRSGSERAVQ